MSRPPPPPPVKPLAERPPAERASGSALIGILRRARWLVAEVISTGSLENASRACSGVGFRVGFGFGLRLVHGLGSRFRLGCGSGLEVVGQREAHLGTVAQCILEHITLTQQAATHVDSLLCDSRLVEGQGGGEGGGELWVDAGVGLGFRRAAFPSANAIVSIAIVSIASPSSKAIFQWAAVRSV